MEYEAVIGLEVHAELRTHSKMFCACPVVDPGQAQPNTAVCPVCAGMPGTLPVVNRQAVELGLRVALALECAVAPVSIFARKNYFYPDLPKGYQISQFEQPLAQHGRLVIPTPQGERAVRVRRVHLEEDAGKLTHVDKDGESFSLVDLNRAGLPLLEIVSEPDLHSAVEARSYAGALRALLRCLGANSGDMEKGVIRFEANISVRPRGSTTLGTRVEIKNLNSFRALERGIDYEIQHQIATLERGETVIQQTVGWDEVNGVTLPQRSKEEAHDYRYFPEPDLPPLVIDPEWLRATAASLPELPRAKAQRLRLQYDLAGCDVDQLSEDVGVADYFEQTAQAAPQAQARTVYHWITGELFGWMNQTGETIEALRVSPAMLADLLKMLAAGEINQPTAKSVLSEMLRSGEEAGRIIAQQGLRQISGMEEIAVLVRQALAEHPQEIASYLDGKETVANWLFGQVMRSAGGKANPAVVRAELLRQLAALKSK